MLRSIILLILISASAPLFAQSFEGKILYRNTYKSKVPAVSDEQLGPMMGTKYEYFIKGGDYKVVTNGSFLQWQLYINKDNKLYTKMETTETILWNDGSMNMDEVISSELNRNATEILGYKCDELVLHCKSGIQKFYFSDHIKLDPALYAQHKFGNWAEFTSLTNSLPLKSIIDNAQFTVESTATSVQPIKIDKSFLELPPNAVTMKSPY